MLDKYEFERETGIFTDTIVDEVVGVNDHRVMDIEWFYNHVNYRVRYLMANNPNWVQKSRSKFFRDFLREYVIMWYAAFNKNSNNYIRQFPAATLDEGQTDIIFI